MTEQERVCEGPACYWSQTDGADVPKRVATPENAQPTLREVHASEIWVLPVFFAGRC